MLKTWIFMAATLGFLLYALFYGCMLLIAPNRCPAFYKWGQPSVVLVRKPPLQLGKRLLGLCLSVTIVFIFMRPIITGMLHPSSSALSYGNSPFRPGVARWDKLGFGLLVGFGAYYFVSSNADLDRKRRLAWHWRQNLGRDAGWQPAIPKMKFKQGSNP
jgi:hypothetical protein